MKVFVSTQKPIISGGAGFLFVTRASVRELRDTVRPAAWVLTGDLTDAKAPDTSGSRQYEEEWVEYRGVVEEAGPGAVWLDIRGNHDNFDVPHPAHRWQQIVGDGQIISDHSIYSNNNIAQVGCFST